MIERIAQAFSRHGYLLALGAIALSTALFLPGRGEFAKGQWALLYLLVILLVASAAGPGPAVLAAVLAFFAWNFFFLPPYHTLEIRDPKDWLSLVAFLVVGVLVGALAGRMRDREARARRREQETAALNRLSTAVVSQTSTGQMAESCLSEIVEVLGATSAALFLEEAGELVNYRVAPAGAEVEPSMSEHATGTYLACSTESEVGLEPGDGGLYVPVRSPSGVSGVLTVQARRDGRPYSSGDARLVTSLSNMVGAYLERERLQGAATAAAAAREADHLKSSLLSSVSHELKTPLAALTATVSNLLESDVDWDEESVRDELRAIVGDIARLNSSIGALLELSRLEAHAWEPQAGALRARRDRRPPASTPCRRTCANACAWSFPTRTSWSTSTSCSSPGSSRTCWRTRYSTRTVPVTVGARGWNEGVRLWVEDQGQGIPADEHEAVFEKFFRGRRSGQHAPSGTGLGLAIAREIVRSHGGTIAVDDVAPHGARFVITMTTAGEPERPEKEESA